MQVEELRDVVVKALEDMKAKDIVVIDVTGRSSVTDVMVIASGTSSQHVKALAESVASQAKAAGETPLGLEGVNEGEWALIDINCIVVHVMLPKVRDFYQLERLWNLDIPATETAVETN